MSEIVNEYGLFILVSIVGIMILGILFMKGLLFYGDMFDAVLQMVVGG